MRDLPEELSETYNYKCIINQEDISKHALKTNKQKKHALNNGVTKY